MGFLSGKKELFQKNGKLLWNNLCAAFAMFSKIPVPAPDWNQDNLQYMLCFFPLIGAVSGLLSLAAAAVGLRLKLHENFICVLLVLIPILLTGGIHLDGFLDTVDALSSWQGKEKKREILKDPHTGAFAVIAAVSIFAAWFGAYSQLLPFEKGRRIAAFGFLLSRALSGLAVIVFPKSSESGTVSEFSEKASVQKTRKVLFWIIVLVSLCMIWIHPLYGLSSVLYALIIFLIYYHTAIISFGGTNGDLAGWFLCLCETGILLLNAILSGILG